VVRQQYLEECTTLMNQVKDQAAKYKLDGLVRLQNCENQEVLDPNLSVVNFLETTDLLKFKDSCWILLTSPKPASQLAIENSKSTKDFRESKNSAKGATQNG